MAEPIKMWDASNPAITYPAWLKAGAGYIGGDTPNVWSPTQWSALGDRKKLPIWVRSDPITSEAEHDAFNILRSLFTLGVPHLSPVALDLETAVAPSYVLRVHRIIHFFGYELWIYGSEGTVFQNPVCDGYWVATLDGVRRMVSHPEVKATQYIDHGPFDTSLVSSEAYEHDLVTW